MTPDLGKYAAEVLLAYAGTVVLLAGLLIASIRSARAARRQLDAAEKRRADG